MPWTSLFFLYFFWWGPLCSPASGADEIAQSRRTAVVRAVELAEPSVVSVHVTYRQQVLYRSRDPFMEFFFPLLSPYNLIPGEQERTSSGSGLIVSKSGFILTNDHVVGLRDNPYKISISLPDGRSYEAKYIDTYISYDLAILKAEASDLPVARLGNSDDILVGEWAVAIGNPFDLGPTVSVGVVSAVNRDFSEPQGNYYYRDLIQTDAPINPGNSGGPLVNALGEVIGINSFIYTGSEYSIGSIGIGFAIPISTARSFLQEIELHGKVRRPWSGILGLKNLTATLVKYLDLPSADGALVLQVAPESPAKLAGLERGDVIVRIDQEKVRSAEEAKSLLQGFRVGESCELTFLREGKTRTCRLRLAEMPSARQRWD
ncbi:MAG: trypsin-like peptidase domain-containing protein [Candidatus Latescibacteria bacterium]|nr:trypsin-like peptidase domain-containing protein [Candidatus Latescibacterota bacterium]